MAAGGTSWDELTAAERAGVVQCAAVHVLGSPALREWTPGRLRRVCAGDSFMIQVAEAMEAELAAREARKRLYVVAGTGPRLRPPRAGSGAPRLRVLDGCTLPPGSAVAEKHPEPGRRRTGVPAGRGERYRR